MKRLALSVIALLVCIVSNAQDTIRTKTDTLFGKVEEIGIDEIRYKAFDNLSGPTIVIDKRDVIEIRYQNGKKTLIQADPYEANTELEIRNKNHCIKFEFLSPLLNDVAFGYEHVLKVGMNIEFKAAIIGPGFQQYDLDAEETKPFGAWFKCGLKFLTSPTYYKSGTKYAHALKGFYIKPEVIFSMFNRTVAIQENSYWGTINDIYHESLDYYNGAFNIVFGNQHLLGNIITIDYYLGLGYGFREISGEQHGYNMKEDYVFSHAFFSNESAFMMTAGLTVGVPF